MGYDIAKEGRQDMSKKRYNVVQAKEIPGRDKPIWLKCGMVFADESGMVEKARMKLELLPVPDAEGNIWLNFFEADNNQGQQSNEGFKPSGYDEAGGGSEPQGSIDDDIPF